MLRAYGAEVVITPTAVDPHSPESYYSVSDRLAEEIPGGFKPDQYSNPANPEAHYETTGPELWEQTDGGEIDAIVISVGTGGTITGVGRYFKEHGGRRCGSSPSIPRDRCSRRRGPPDGAVPGRGDRQGALAHDPRPRGRGRVGACLGSRLVPHRPTARTRGRPARGWVDGVDRVGGQGGGEDARQRRAGPHDVPGQRAFVPLEVLRRQLDDPVRLPRAGDAAARRRRGASLPTRRARDVPELVTIGSHEKVGAAIDVMQRYGISQLPVVRDEPVDSLADVVGSLQERELLERVFRNADALNEDVAVAMQPPLPAVDVGRVGGSGVRGAVRRKRCSRRRDRRPAGRHPHAV